MILLLTSLKTNVFATMLLESNLITLKVEYSLLLTLALEGSQLHATEGAEVDGRKTLTINFKVERCG